mgnify:CR=1 FL=1
MKCEICQFNNPKATVTAIILRNNSLLLLKRNEEPFKDYWDFLGGYMNEGEIPEVAMIREVKEEIGIEPLDVTFFQAIPGKAYWKDKEFPILSQFFLVDIGDKEIKLNNENSQYTWIPLKDFDPEIIAWDSNQAMAKVIKEKFTFNLEIVRELVKQLDPIAEFKEQSLYRAILNGYVSKFFINETLVGLGWIFPRQTLLRKQAIIEDMIVSESCRGMGIGRLILKDLLGWAKENNMDMVELTTNPNRIAANELYKSEGFWLHNTNHYLYNVNSQNP